MRWWCGAGGLERTAGVTRFRSFGEGPGIELHSNGWFGAPEPDSRWGEAALGEASLFAAFRAVAAAAVFFSMRCCFFCDAPGMLQAHLFFGSGSGGLFSGECRAFAAAAGEVLATGLEASSSSSVAGPERKSLSSSNSESSSESDP